MNRPVVAAITLDARGGGVATVSRLLWQVVQERWQSRAQLFTLVGETDARRSLEAPTRGRLRFGARLARAQALRECDWILYTHLAVARVQCFVPALVHRPYAVFIHGIEVWRPLTADQRAVLKGASLLVANSAFTARCVNDMHPDIGTVIACPLALPNARLESTVPDCPVENPVSRAVLLVARMSASERYKGHDELIDAWPAVLARVPDAKLVFAGDGDDAPRLKAKAAALGLAGAVTFTGFVRDAQLQSLYRSAAVFAMPSRAEGFGLVYLEAMARQLPCIGGLEDAASEVIVDGVTGFLVQQADRGALTDRIVRLLRDEGLRQAMGRAGQRRVFEHFSYEKFSRRMMSLIESHLGVDAESWCRDVAI